jgi:hypothetical protein
MPAGLVGVQSDDPRLVDQANAQLQQGMDVLYYFDQVFINFGILPLRDGR